MSVGDGDTETRSSGLPVLLGVALAVLVADQLTKVWAVQALADRNTVELFWTARFKLVRNDGAAFSLGSGLTPLIAVAALGVSVAVVILGRNVKRCSVLVALGLILGGALGNVIDRLFRSGGGFLRGAVVDFMDLQWWPVFNVADMGIVVGGLLLVALMSESRGGGEDWS